MKSWSVAMIFFARGEMSCSNAEGIYAGLGAGMAAVEAAAGDGTVGYGGVWRAFA